MMQLFLAIILASAASVSLANLADLTELNATTVYVTEVHTAFTTVCPTPTQFVYNGVTYVANQSTTLTVTNCPCTVVKPIITTSSVYCSICQDTSPHIPVYGNNSQTKPTGTGHISTYATSTSAITSPTHVISSASKPVAFSSSLILGIISLYL